MTPSMPTHISGIRNRDQALDALVPKFLGALWWAEPGPVGVPAPDDTRLRVGGVTFQVDPGLAIGGSALNTAYVIHSYIIHAYARQADADWIKVFSAHLADAIFGDPKTFKYWRGRCAILSWKRGLWEDRLYAVPVEPRSLAHVHTAGLSRKKIVSPNS